MSTRVPTSHVIAYDPHEDKITMVWATNEWNRMQSQSNNCVRTYSPLYWWQDYFIEGGLVILESQ